jgi:hypothetical protein
VGPTRLVGETVGPTRLVGETVGPTRLVGDLEHLARRSAPETTSRGVSRPQGIKRPIRRG